MNLAARSVFKLFTISRGERKAFRESAAFDDMLGVPGEVSRQRTRQIWHERRGRQCAMPGLYADHINGKTRARVDPIAPARHEGALLLRRSLWASSCSIGLGQCANQVNWVDH